jgi:pheromone shutdown protein TraB
MTSVLRKCPGNKIVAVIGKGHVSGIKYNFTQPLPNIAPLLLIQHQPPLWQRIVKTVIVIASLSLSVRYFVKKLK